MYTMQNSAISDDRLCHTRIVPQLDSITGQLRCPDVTDAAIDPAGA